MHVVVLHCEEGHRRLSHFDLFTFTFSVVYGPDASRIDGRMENPDGIKYVYLQMADLIVSINTSCEHCRFTPRAPFIPKKANTYHNATDAAANL